MKRFIASLITTVLVAGGLIGGSIVAASPVFASAQSDACAGIGLSGASCTGTGAQTQVQSTLTTVINFISVGVGVAAVVMIIVAGTRYITSGGDTSKTAGAKSTLLYAVIGLFVVAAAQTIVHFVLNNV